MARGSLRMEQREFSKWGERLRSTTPERDLALSLCPCEQPDRCGEEASLCSDDGPPEDGMAVCQREGWRDCKRTSGCGYHSCHSAEPGRLGGFIFSGDTHRVSPEGLKDG